MNQDHVESFFKRIGVGRPKSEAIFLKKGHKRFGKAFDEIMSLIAARADGAEIDPYDPRRAYLGA
jgi:hypothetical protein